MAHLFVGIITRACTSTFGEDKGRAFMGLLYFLSGWGRNMPQVNFKPGDQILQNTEEMSRSHLLSVVLIELRL